MSDGTVSGRFRLDVDPAVRGVDKYELHARKAMTTTRSLGNEIDRTFGAKRVAKIEETAAAFGHLGDKAVEMRVKVNENWTSARRKVQTESAEMTLAIDGVSNRMRAFSRQRATATIAINDTRANAQIDRLEARLARVGATTARPNVAVGSSGGLAAGGAGGGGGGRRGFGVGRGLLLGAGALALPLGSTAIGSATAIGASGIGAAAGVGAIGLGGFGVGAAGLAAFMAEAKPAIAQYKAVTKAQDAYTKAVAEYGVGSQQAKRAHMELDREIGSNRGLLAATKNVRAFKREWTSLTADGRNALTNSAVSSLQRGRKVAPFLAGVANRSNTAIGSAATSQVNFLTSAKPREDLDRFSRVFVHDLPIAESSLQNIESTFLNLTRAALPFFHEGNLWVEKQTDGWAKQSSDINAVRTSMHTLVGDTRDWWHLTRDTYTLLRDIGHLAAPSGNSLVNSLDEWVKTQDAFIKRNPNAVRSWFDRNAASAKSFASGVSGVVHELSNLAEALRPIFDRLSQVASVAGSLGVIGTPGIGAFAYGAYKGARGGAAGAGGSAATAATGLAAMSPATMATAAIGYGAVQSANAARRGALNSPASRFSRVAGTLESPIGPSSAPLVGGVVGGARYGAPVSELGARSTLAGRTASRVGGAASAGLRRAGPLVALFAALDFASTQGNVGTRAQSALNTATFGLVPRPQTKAQLADVATQRASQFVSGLDTTSITGTRNGIGSINSEIARLQGKLASPNENIGGFRKFVGGGDNKFFGIGLGGSKLSGEQRTEAQDRIRLLQQEATALKATNAEMERQQKRSLDVTSQRRARNFTSQLGSAYSSYSKGGNQAYAASKITSDVARRLGNTRDGGVQTLGQGALDFAKQAGFSDKQIATLTADIANRFKKMGRDISIVNGQILTGTSSEWTNIRTALTSESEKAREGVTSDFTAIQQQALGSLTAMGYSKSNATQFLKDVEAGKVSSNPTIAMGPAEQRNAAGVRGNTLNHSGRRNASGGPIPGKGLLDTVSMGGAMVAPGEWVVNRHTMKDLSAATISKYGITAEQMIKGERRKHSMPMRATGGFVAAPGTNFSYGAEPQIAADLGKLGRRLHATVTGISGYRTPEHSVAVGGFADDPHTRGQAADIGVPGGFLSSSSADAMLKAVGLYRPFYPAQAKEINHVQLLGGGARGTSSVATGTSGSQIGGGSISLTAPGNSQGGVPGALRKSAGAAYAAALSSKLSSAMGGADASSQGATTGLSGGTSGQNQELGRKMMLAAGFDANQWPALKQLWTGESGWNNKARNPSSGAFGIPQALPASKMGPAAVAGDARAQISWGLNYIRDRYRTPSQALAAWNSRSPHWYATGGQMPAYAGAFEKGGSFRTNGPTMFMAGDGTSPHEDVHISKSGKGSKGGIKVHNEIHIHGDGLNSDEIVAKLNASVAGSLVKVLDKLEAGVA